MKRILLGSLLLLNTITFAQNAAIKIEGVSGELYIHHVIDEDDSFLSLASTYNLSPNDVAHFNNLTFKYHLKPGQIIKIPLTKNNFNRTGADKDKRFKLKPLTRHFEKMESIINVIYDYDLHDSLIRKWNPQIKYEIPAKTNLVIGYIKMKQ